SWTPRNVDRTHHGAMTVKWALMQSINVAAAKLITQIGPEAVVETATRFGITSPLRPHLSLALGTSGVSPLEMASAFGTFAAGGLYAQPMGIGRVEDYRGRILAEQLPRRKQVANPQSVFQVVEMMRGVVDGGTGRLIRQAGFDRPCAGKTGTTDEYTDAWFTGFTPTLSVSVWVGYDDNRSMRLRDGAGVTGTIGAIPIWTAFMLAAYQNQPVQDFSVPPGIEFVSIDPKTGQVVTEETAERIVVAMKAGS
ncbi:MAG: carboxypeptidase, partial [Candidatus Latescibacteria bacterium]|nr:carboxypeptidase [Candidatus Latescibacterota bacterium]